MRRTIPSFRIASMMEEREWKVFHKSLNKSDRKVFDNMFDIAHLYNSDFSYTANPIRLHPIFISIIFHHYKQLTMIAKQIEANTQRDPSSEPF
ncbi:MAG: hypothetical protein WA421_12755 [Nitrososphaeraceae archaeon]